MQYVSTIYHVVRHVWQGPRYTFLLFLSLTITVCHRNAGATQIYLAWSDNSDNESGFRVERRLGTDGTFATIATVGVNSSSYTDVNLTPGTSYCYRVVAFNATGESAYSNETCATASSLMAALESPENGQPVSGIGVIRGWTFDTQVGRQVSSVELLIDGTLVSSILCCSSRSDVESAFPQFSLQNALNSGWGITVNWGGLNAGTHAVQVKVKNTAGETLSALIRTVTVVRLGDFPFIDQFALSGATAQIEGEDLVLGGVIVRDKVTQRQNEIIARFRWFTNSQSFGMVQAETTAEIASLRSVLSAPFASLARWLWKGTTLASAQAAPGVIGLIESPESGQIVSGIGIFRGWAFTEDPGATVRTIQMLVDGQPVSPLLCCFAREDVAVAFPGNPNALSSGWGMPVNYGNLSAGVHTLGVQVEDSLGGTYTLEHGVEVIQVGGFPFLDQFILSGATARVEGEDIVVSGVQVRDKISQQIRVIEVRLRWFQNSQSLGIVAST